MTTTVLQPCAEDAFASTTNYSSQTYLYSGFYTYAYRAWMKFAGLSNGTIPHGALISAASVSLYAYDDDAGSSYTHYIHRNTADYTYTTVTLSAPPAYDATELGSRAFGTTDRGFCEFTLSAAEIQKIVNGTYNNYGFTLRCGQEGANSVFRFYSSRYATDTSYRPKMSITWNSVGGILMFFDRLKWKGCNWIPKGGIWQPKESMVTI